MAENPRKRKKGFYKKAALSNKWAKYQTFLQSGFIGFFLTCNKHERETVTEAYRILNSALERVNNTSAPSSETCDAVTTLGTDVKAENQATKPVEKSIEIDKHVSRVSQDAEPSNDDKESTVKNSLNSNPDDKDYVQDVIDTNQNKNADSTHVDIENREDIAADDDSDSDIESALRRESEVTKKTVHTFQQVRTGVNNCLFIRYNPASIENSPNSSWKPTQLTNDIFSQAASGAASQGRYVLRFLPVEATCRAEISEMKKTLCLLWTKFVEKMGTSVADESKPMSFSIQFKVRNFNNLSRDTALRELNAVISEVSPSFVREHICPSIVIAVNVLKTVCCFSILDKFIEYQKYNLQEF